VEPAAPATRASGGALERWFETTSVLPLAAFAALHVGAYGRVLFGVTEMGARERPSPWLLAAEALFLWVPLGFHVAVAPRIWRQRRAESPPTASGRASLTLHRASGVVLAFFLLDHFVRFRLPVVSGARLPAESLQALAAELSSTTFGVPLVAFLHTLGVLALGFHLGFGLWRSAERRPGLAGSRKLFGACVCVGATIVLVGTLTVIRLAAG
jgi:succinate dehydrogenase/fumarate reductase cytochrome b subunit